MNSADNSLDIFNKVKKYIAKNDDSYALDEFQKQYSPTNAVYWYTKNSFIYRLLNKAIRTRNIDILYTLKSLLSIYKPSLHSYLLPLQKSEHHPRLLYTAAQ